MIAQGHLPTGQFTLDLSDSSGTLTFNDPDLQGYVYHNVDDSTYPGVWMIPAKGSFGLSRPAVIDSGSVSSRKRR